MEHKFYISIFYQKYCFFNIIFFQTFRRVLRKESYLFLFSKRKILRNIGSQVIVHFNSQKPSSVYLTTENISKCIK